MYEMKRCCLGVKKDFTIFDLQSKIGCGSEMSIIENKFSLLPFFSPFTIFVKALLQKISIMAIEIERKFLVAGDFMADVYQSEPIKQGYICSKKGKTVRVRIRGEKAFLTIKGPADENKMSRYEFETALTMEDAQELFALCGTKAIDKVRHMAKVGDHVWEIDVFHGANEGLVVAEIELHSEEESFERPCWLGEEVTQDRRYYNSMLTKHPYSEWKGQD